MILQQRSIIKKAEKILFFVFNLLMKDKLKKIYTFF